MIGNFGSFETLISLENLIQVLDAKKRIDIWDKTGDIQLFDGNVYQLYDIKELRLNDIDYTLRKLTIYSMYVSFDRIVIKVITGKEYQEIMESNKGLSGGIFYQTRR